MVDNNPIVALKLQQAIETAIVAQDGACHPETPGAANTAADPGPESDEKTAAVLASTWRLSNILALSPNSHRFDIHDASADENGLKIDTEGLRKRRTMRRLSFASMREDRYTALHSVNPTMQRISFAHPDGAIANAMRNERTLAQAARTAAQDLSTSLEGVAEKEKTNAEDEQVEPTLTDKTQATTATL